MDFSRLGQVVCARNGIFCSKNLKTVRMAHKKARTLQGGLWGWLGLPGRRLGLCVFAYA